MHIPDENIRPAYDAELVSIADYVLRDDLSSEIAYTTARYCLMDALGCAILALQYPACTRLLGPIIPVENSSAKLNTYSQRLDFQQGASERVEGVYTKYMTDDERACNTAENSSAKSIPIGARVPGTNYLLDPILAAFNIGTLVRWLDFNDTWLAAEWGHPSDNLGAILAVTDYLSRKKISDHQKPLSIKDVLTAMIKAHEIQGILALENGFNRLGFDHVLLVKIASTAVATQLLGGTREQIMDALSQACLDGAALRTYRHAPNTGSRKSWAAGDATSRGTRLAWITLQGEMGYPSALTAQKWGFYDTVMQGKSLKFARPFGTYVMENVLFKISFPAEFHAQTAVECAITITS